MPAGVAEKDGCKSCHADASGERDDVWRLGGRGPENGRWDVCPLDEDREAGPLAAEMHSQTGMRADVDGQAGLVVVCSFCGLRGGDS